MNANGCSAPVRGHVSGSQEEKDCPVHGMIATVLRMGANPVVSAPPKMTKAASIHRAASDEFTPENYEFVGAYDLKYQSAEFNKKTKDVDWVEDLPYGDNCSHCGKRLRYTAVMHHKPTGKSITVGETCLGDRFSVSKEEFRLAREIGKERAAAAKAELAAMEREKRNAELERLGLEHIRKEVEQAAERREKFIADNPVAVWLTYPEALEGVGFAPDLARQFKQNHSLTERQVAALENMLKRDIEFKNTDAIREQRRLEALASGAMAPVGKNITVRGPIISIKRESNPYDRSGNSVITKMLVNVDGDARVWVTMPAALGDADASEGDVVEFTADFVPSRPRDGKEADPLFSIGKRPRNAKVLNLS